MSTQLTLQAPLALPPDQVPGYLERLWDRELGSSPGAATFTLVVWEGSSVMGSPIPIYQTTL
ncbi:MAG: hypothetical protein NWS10_07825 [Cyanobium sp. MAG_216]|nr:hypothetical protein [Cyanobium sp. MAG_216]